MATVGDIRSALLNVAEECTGKASQLSDRQAMNYKNADQALAAKNWTAAALSAAQAYKTLGDPSRPPAARRP